MKKLYACYCKVEEIICGTGFVSIVALVFISAIARGIRYPLQWSIDISQLLLAWVSFLGADIAWRYGQLLGIDLVTKRLPEKLRKILELLILFLVTASLIILVIFGFRLAKSNWARSMQVVRMSYSFVTLSLPVVSISMTISTLIKIYQRIRNFSPANQSPVQR
ncbi:MAG: TRAP transporter small permease [Treponema sp.]|jgi:TRAP-type C4-dicarboxylate transport system permease small subunit|nr:TRAP transporter small permease [Treponema sp.]